MILVLEINENSPLLKFKTAITKPTTTKKNQIYWNQQKIYKNILNKHILQYPKKKVYTHQLQAIYKIITINTSFWVHLHLRKITIRKSIKSSQMENSLKTNHIFHNTNLAFVIITFFQSHSKNPAYFTK